MKSDTVVELVGVNGVVYNLTTGDKGIFLAEDPKGAFYDPPVKCVYEEPGNYSGSRYLNHRVLRRDITFGVEILNDAMTGVTSWAYRDSAWRKAWAFDKDATLRVTTPESGTRTLKVRLLESPDVDMRVDPKMQPIVRTVMSCVAPDPFWYGADAVFTGTTTGASGTISLVVSNCNPTDQYIFPKWTLPGSSQAPSEPYIPGLPWLGAPTSPQVKWTVPDYSFEDATLATRRVKMPGLIGGLRTEEVQNFNLDGIIQAGTLTITQNGETTPSLAWDATVGQVKAALEALAGIAYDEVDVTRGPFTREVQVLQLEGATGGTFTLSFGGQTTAPINFNCSDAELRTKLIALGAIGLFDLTVQSKAANECQTITVVGEPTEGTFTLTWDGQTTAPIPYNATALNVELALKDLSNVSLTDLYVTREWFKKWAPYKVYFSGLASGYKGVAVPSISGNADGLGGGAGLDIVVAKESVGGRPYVLKFGGARLGQNVPELTANTSGLTAFDPTKIKATIYTDVPGSRPYIVRFRNGLAGQNYPLFVINTGGLTGFATIGYRSWKTVDGYTAPAENCFIDVDPRSEQVISESGSVLWSRMNGVRYRHPIPPYTGAKTFVLDYTGATTGQMVSLRLPRPWSRPWGLE